MIFKQLREYLVFSRKERNGLLILITVLLLVISADFFVPLLVPHKEYDTTEWKKETEKYYSSVSVKPESVKPVFRGLVNPNEAGKSVLLQMGLPAGLASNWVKYLEKGGRFRKKEDVMKLYGMTGELYHRIEEYIEIPVQEKSNFAQRSTKYIAENKTPVFSRKDSVRSEHFNFKEKKELQQVDINKADSILLESLPGIGPVLAARIVKFRKLIGGFYEVSQLKDMYGMTEELFARASPRLMADPSGIQKLDINFLSLSELGRHPYIGFRQARKLVKSRDIKGKLTSKADLTPIFSADSLQRLLPYLSISE